MEVVRGLEKLERMGRQPRRNELERYLAGPPQPIHPGIVEVSRLARKALKVERAALNAALRAGVRMEAGRIKVKKVQRIA